MGGLAPLLASAATQDFGAIAKRARRNFLLYAVTALFAMTAYVVGVIAAALYLAQILGPAAAALVVALSALVLALLVIAVVMILNRRDRRRKPVNTAGKAMLTTVAISALPILMRSKPLMGLVAVGGIAYFLLRPRRTSGIGENNL